MNSDTFKQEQTTFKSDQKLSPSDFKVVSVLGQGAYGKVYLVLKKSGQDKGKPYAMKTLKKTEILR
jgi:serine/threonine protein kinase